VKRFVAVFLCLVCLAVALPACATSREDGPILIGAAGPFTGELSKIGLDSLNAIKMAVKEFNDAGGIDGRLVEVLEGDDAGDPATGNVVADKFAGDPRVLGVIGPMNSSVVNAVLPIYDKANLAVISQSATTPELTELGYKVMFRVCPRDDSQGKAAATFIAEKIRPEKVYILDDKSVYGQGLADEVVKNLETLGGFEIKRDQVGAQDKEFGSVVTRLKEFGPDLVYTSFSNPSQAAALAKQLMASGEKPVFMGGDGCKEKDQLIGGGGDAVQGMYVTAIGRDLREVQEAAGFVEKFEREHGAMSIFSGQSYEATKILLSAIKAASEKGDLTREAVLSEVAATKEYRGILGFPISFDSKGDLIGGEILVLTVKGDDFEEVLKYETGKF
jgi:branched-chain amino acid transport system substrate-binding protein